MKGYGLLLLGLVTVLIAPIALRRGAHHLPTGEGRSLVIITPHNEAIRHEFGRAFAEHQFLRSGERVRVDWRTPGGTSEITRYLASEFLSAFQRHWTSTLRKPWSTKVERAFADPKTTLDDTPADDTIEQQARRAFLQSNVSSRIDLFFGGGAFDFQSQAAAGYLIDSGFIAAHPELFNENAIPQKLSGEPFWDPAGRWIGTVVSSFGICFNTDALRRLGVKESPVRWEDLANPRFLREIALANPTQSSSVNKSFEMLIQEQMQHAVRERKAPTGEEADALREGWTRAMRLLMRIGANARYFTDASTKISLDVSTGEAAAGMTIDFYGRFQSEAMRRPDGTSPLRYVDVPGGSSVGVDPIGLFRGAPQPELAREFIAFTMSTAGQKLWNWKPRLPDGPERYALRRLPVLPFLYAPEMRKFRTDPEVSPYVMAQSFTYQEKWTGPLFRSISFIFRVMCIDSHDELAAAWRALIASGFPPKASAVFEDVSAVDMPAAAGPLREALTAGKIHEVRLARELADRFRTQYRRAAELARAGQ